MAMLLFAAPIFIIGTAVEAASCRVAVIGTGIAGGAFSHYLQVRYALGLALGSGLYIYIYIYIIYIYP